MQTWDFDYVVQVMRVQAMVWREDDIGTSARLQNSVDLSHCCPGVVHVLKDIVADDGIEEAIAIGYLGRGADSEMTVGHPHFASIRFAELHYVFKRLDTVCFSCMARPDILNRLPAVSAAEIKNRLACKIAGEARNFKESEKGVKMACLALRLRVLRSTAL